MILVLSGFLVVIDNMSVDSPESPNQCLLVASILTTSHLSIEPVHDLKTITKIVLHRSSTGLVVEHVEHLTKIHRGAIGSSVSDQPKHDAVRVVLQLDVLVHPYLT
ncbi:putative AC5 protein [Sida chlorotic leaf virus]|uniref:AC5 protein n=1 Tax=Sida chlorotic leaf virus TaxID=2593923 RepID=A0A514TTS8_9GEMI|nr:putative AC5 protein [Sida chlorotic leaf virus]QDJ95892.1 putative AC5 protein [Sida chlorotic leaf virus]